MNRRWAEWRIALLLAIGAPLAGLVLAVGTLLATTDGPAMLADNWTGRTLMTLLGFAGYALVLFTQLRYFNVVVFFGAFFAFFMGLYMITDAIEERALHQRGATATCAVLQLEKRVVTNTDSEGHTTTRTYFDHTLDCPNAPITELTTEDRRVEKGQKIDIRYDTTGRVSPRPADAVGDHPSPLWPGLALFGGGVVLRLLYELEVPVFRHVEYGFGWTNRLRRWRYRR
jgi:hypothetical protein